VQVKSWREEGSIVPIPPVSAPQTTTSIQATGSPFSQMILFHSNWRIEYTYESLI